MGKAKATAAAAAIEGGKIHGIDAEKIKPEAVEAGLAACDIAPAKGADLAAKVALLVEHFKGLPEKDLADCDSCGAASDYHLDCCPFCGVGGEAAPPAEPAAAEPADEDADQDDPDAAERDAISAEVEEAEQEEFSPDAEPEPAATAPTEPAPAPAASPTGLTRVRGKGVAKAKARPEVIDAVAEPTELDSKIAEIRQLQRGAAAGAYVLATKISELAKTQLWKQRRSADGKVAYKNFEQFAKAELDMSRKYVTELQRLHARFSEKEFAEIGPTKLRLVLQAPEAKQSEVLKKIKEGAGKREAAKTVQKARAEAGMKNSRGEKPKPAKATTTITVASIERRKTVKLWKKPAKKGEDLSPAKRLADVPFGSIDLANDVRLFFEIHVGKDGQLEARTEVRRVEE